jgi:LacI family transcriptional regulator
MKSQKKTRRIALALPSGVSFIERILKGILEYCRTRGDWTFIRLPERLDPSLEWLRSCKSDGAFIMVSTEEAAKVARSLPMPVVNLTAHLQVPDLPTVMVDHQEAGRLAARHLIERSFSRFAYYGTSDLWYSRERRAGFLETIKAHGGECATLEVPSSWQAREKWVERQDELKEWLESLRGPVGIMASTDLRACMAADACTQIGLRIPDDVALIGVDNDPASELHEPPLSSVSRSDAAVGLCAATLLDRLMAGGSPPDGPVLIPPDAIICRRSTETLAIDDSRISKAVAYIYKNVHRPFGVEELLNVASMPRRTFEQHFLKMVGMTPYLFINKCRVERAILLMAAPNKRSLTEIACICGFSDLHRFRLVFSRLTGIPPAAYRSSELISEMRLPVMRTQISFGRGSTRRRESELAACLPANGLHEKGILSRN